MQIIDTIIHKLGLFYKQQFYCFAIIVIVVLSFMVYANSFNNKFTNWDDQDLIVNNSKIRSLDWKNLKQIFAFHKGSTYQPLRVLSYAIDYHFWGMNHVGYHLQSIVWHTLAAILLFLILDKLLPQIQMQNNRVSEKNMRLIAFATSVLFVIHPINVEAVSWLSDRKYVLLSFFSFLSLYCFIKSSEGETYSKILYTLISLFACALAVCSSPFGIAVPGLLFLCDYCREYSINPFNVLKKRFIYYTPYFIWLLIAAPLLWRALVAGNKGGADVGHYMGKAYITFFTMLRMLFDYFRNIIIPLWLNNRYTDYPSLSILEVKIVVVLLCLSVCTIFLILQIKKREKFDLFCLGWFFILWSPASNVIPISTKMADRYIYIAVPGILLWIVFFLFVRLSSVNLSYRSSKVISFTLIAVILVFYASLTIQRNNVWSDSVSLWKDSLKKDPKNYIALHNLGCELAFNGKIQDGIEYLKKAVALQAGFVEAHLNLATLFFRISNFDEAIVYYQNAISLGSNNYKIYNDFGISLASLGKSDKALIYYQKAIDLNPKFADSYQNIGRELAKQGSLEKAIKYYEKAIALKSNFALAHYNLGRALFRSGKIDEAIKHYEIAIDQGIEGYEIYINIGMAFFKINQFEDASKYYTKALKESETIEAHYKMGLTLAKLGNINEAITHYKLSLKDDHNNVEKQINLASALIYAGSANEAIKYCKKTIDLSSDKSISYYYLGKAFASLVQYESAISSFKKSIELNHNFFNAHYELANTLFFSNHFKDAILQYKKLLEIDPNFAKAYNNLGFIYYKQGVRKKAIEYLKKALDIDPLYADAHYNIANVYLGLKDTKSAIQHYESAIKIRPAWPEALSNLSYIYAKSSDPNIKNAEKSLYLSKTAFEMASDKPIIVYRLAIAYASVNDFDNAIQFTKTAISLALDQGSIALVRQMQKQLDLYQKYKSNYKAFNGNVFLVDINHICI